MPIYFTRRKEVRDRAIALGAKNVEWYRRNGNQTDTKTSKAIERNALGCADSYEVEFYWTEIMAKEGLTVTHLEVAGQGPDSGDHLFQGQTRSVKFDVKVACKPHHIFFCVPKVSPVKHDVYIGAQFMNEDCCVFWGWLNRKTVADLPVEGPPKFDIETRFFPRAQMWRFDQLFDHLKKV